MKTIQELKKEQQDRYTELFKKCRVFFAFNNEQFEQNKTKLEEKDNYIHLGSGGYLPESQVRTYLDGVKEIGDWYRDEIKKNKLAEKEILHELDDHECFYTNDIDPAVQILPYSEEEVLVVFNKYKNKR